MSILVKTIFNFHWHISNIVVIESLASGKINLTYAIIQNVLKIVESLDEDLKYKLGDWH